LNIHVCADEESGTVTADLPLSTLNRYALQVREATAENAQFRATSCPSRARG
jgi:hypothetical protein